jgi:hypothetical protein
MFVCFGIAMAAYNRFNLNIALQPLWVNLVAYISPLLLGAFLGYWLVSRVPLVCPTCRGRIERRKHVTSWWRMPTYRFWCEACQRDGLEGIHGPTQRPAKSAGTRDTNW